MSEINSSFRTPPPSQGRRPYVKKHDINWDLVQTSTPVHIRISALGKALHKGCHYLNPMYTVTSREPSIAFYRKAIWARKGWINLFRKTLAKGDFQAYSNKLGIAARQCQITGITYLTGEIVHPDVLERNLRLAENPELALIITDPRRVNLDDLRTPEGQHILLEVMRAELREILFSRREAAFYINPASTLLAPSLTTTFLREVRDAEAHWHGRFRSHLGNQARTLERSADVASKMLLFRGVLAANGRAYRSGHWPDKKPPDGGMDSNPALEDSISWGDLGLA